MVITCLDHNKGSLIVNGEISDYDELWFVIDHLQEVKEKWEEELELQNIKEVCEDKINYINEHLDNERSIFYNNKELITYISIQPKYFNFITIDDKHFYFDYDSFGSVEDCKEWFLNNFYIKLFE